MRITTRFLAPLFMLLFAGAAAQAQTEAVVEVVFTPKVRFADAGDTPYDIERTEVALDKHFKALGKRSLPPGSQLRIEVTEIDLAGDVLPGSINRSRVLKGGADWPRITLRYELTRADGQVERGDAVVSDMDYLRKQSNAYSGEFLAYEKRMLDQWFSKRFAAAPG
jgi:hypothetical protein